MIHICGGLREINLIIWDRFGHHLRLIALHLERIIGFVGHTTTLFCRFKTVFEAVHLTGLPLAVADHLRADRIDIHELLAASRITLLRTATNWLVVAHRRQALISNSTEITTLIKADLILASRLHHLRLVHDLTDLLFKQAVGQNTGAILSSI